MKLTQISLQHFRNISETAFFPHEDVNIIYGDNAQGKTNLLEALWLFTGTKSFRGAKEGELISFAEQEALLQLQFQSGQRDQNAKIQLSREGKKQAELNFVPLATVSELAGNFYAVVFSPSHLSLVKDGPSARRKFLDLSICQILPRYGRLLSDFQRLLKQRNALLRDLRINGSLLDLLEVFDLSLAKLSAQIVRTRCRYVQKLSVQAENAYRGISRDRERLQIIYRCGYDSEGKEGETLLASADGLESAILAQAFLQLLKKNRREDIQMGITARGPHHDDLELLLDGLPARAYGSQGQQRSCILALKLAEGQLLEEVSGQPPIVLLDDVMSELDASRRDYLLNHLQGRQVFITCCEKAYFTGLQAGKCFWVQNGAISEEPLFSS